MSKRWVIFDGWTSDGESPDETMAIETVDVDDCVYTDKMAALYLKRNYEDYDYCIYRWDEGKEPYLVARLLTGFGFAPERPESGEP